MSIYDYPKKADHGVRDLIVGVSIFFTFLAIIAVVFLATSHNPSASGNDKSGQSSQVSDTDDSGSNIGPGMTYNGKPGTSVGGIVIPYDGSAPTMGYGY